MSRQPITEADLHAHVDGVLSSVSAEVSLPKLFDNIHRFPSYIIRLFQLENGRPVWTDLAEWFWGLPRWLRLLGDTSSQASRSARNVRGPSRSSHRMRRAHRRPSTSSTCITGRRDRPMPRDTATVSVAQHRSRPAAIPGRE